MKTNKNQSGNVLFLILIAVALFAALSYAATQSSQSNPGRTDQEADKVNFSTFMNYVTAIRTRVQRMRFSEGIQNAQPYTTASGENRSDVCNANPETCIFGNEIPFHEPDRFNSIFKMNVTNIRTRLTNDGTRIRAFMYFHPIDQNTCEAFNDYMAITATAEDITDENDTTGVIANMETVPVQCFHTTGPDEYVIYFYIYDEKLV